MVDSRSSSSSRRAFFSAPLSVPSTVAALLEPAVIVIGFAAISRVFDRPLERPELVLGLLVFALTFPGRNRFRQALGAALLDIVAGWLSLLALLALCGYATASLELFDRSVLLAWALVTPAALWLSVAAGRWLLDWAARHPRAHRRALVVGAGPVGVRVAGALQSSAAIGVEFVGFFDDRHADRVADEARPNLLGTLQDVAEHVARHGIRDVYLTLPLGLQPRLVQLLESLQDTTVSLFFVPDVLGLTIIQGRLQDLAGMPVVGIRETPFTGINALFKRAIDIALASLILVLASPLMLALAIGVKLGSPGPVIFRQQRTGLDGEPIVVYKFRSMTTQEDGADVHQATREDPRVTRFGHFIRRTSLDELPQFVNVLQGRMSIVGPRPHALAQNELYSHLIKAYMARHKVKPGITGWAQVNGLRGETHTLIEMQRRVEYDLDYLRNWSVALDLQIIARTLRLVFSDPRAY
jgi:putative colanic acid biosynthesis UDP-glucose lipid carrier transferase